MYLNKVLKVLIVVNALRVVFMPNDEDFQCAVKTFQSSSEVTTSWDKRLYLIISREISPPSLPMGLSSLSCFSFLRFSQSLALRLVVLCWRLELFHPWLHSRLSLESNSQSSWRQIMSLLIHRYRSIICSKILGTICSRIASDGILAARRCSDTTRGFIPTREFGNK